MAANNRMIFFIKGAFVKNRVGNDEVSLCLKTAELKCLQASLLNNF